MLEFVKKHARNLLCMMAISSLLSSCSDQQIPTQQPGNPGQQPTSSLQPVQPWQLCILKVTKRDPNDARYCRTEIVVIKNGVWINKNPGEISPRTQTIGSDAWIKEVIVDNNNDTMVRLQLWGGERGWITYNTPNPQYYKIWNYDVLIETCSGASM